MATSFERAGTGLIRFALGYAETREDNPWGERVVKVNKKVFVFFHMQRASLQMTVKLPDSATMALGLPFVKPSGYGLGKSGWVTATFSGKDKPPVAVLKQWIDESYRAIAPKKLLKTTRPARSASRPPRGRGRAS
jgi:predicted DNA-binding protein (MmcQ/YjbR family)